MELILASASPRRAELLREHGYAFRVIVPPVPEPASIGPGLLPAAMAAALSHFKARAVAAVQRAGLILGADTIAAAGDGTIFGKPSDCEDARRILSRLMGTAHEVITGVTLLDAATGRRDIRTDRTLVTMRAVSAGQLESYLDSGQWEGKAGAYGIQDKDDPFVERIDGSYTNVVGLPMELLADMLKDFAA